jgi:hypothetical protein
MTAGLPRSRVGAIERIPLDSPEPIPIACGCWIVRGIYDIDGKSGVH